jgi:ATP-binding cassette, subfamily B, multidrug efflux pump
MSGLLFIILSNLFAIVIPPIVRESVDGVIGLLKNKQLPEYSKYLPSYFDSSAKLAVLSGVLILVASLLKGWCMYYMRMTLIIMSRKIEYEQKNDIFQQYQQMSQRFFSKNYTGDLMNRISDDVSKVRMFTGPAIMYALNLTFMILMVVGLMFSVNATITLWVLIPLPILVVTIYLVSDSINKKSDIIQKKLSIITSYTQETFAGIAVVKSYGRENDFANDFDTLNESYKEDNMALARINGVFMPAVIGLVGLSVLITIYVGGNAVVNGQFSLGNIVEYILYVNMLTWPVASLGYVTSLVQQGAASQARIEEFLNIPAKEDLGIKTISKLEKGIVFDNVSFRYSDTDEWVLRHVSFNIDANTKFGIIGTTGSGKSTIAKLLMGVYDPTEGEIRLDGVCLKEYSRKSLKTMFAYVAQDIFLFSDSLKANILFGITSEDQASNLEQAVDTASLTEEIKGFPNGLETILGERGITLSGGQKQRTAIARALVKNPTVLLIDDGLSAVDTKTEVRIKNGLKKWGKEQTFINISHRISSIQDCSQIIFLDHGKIIEHGNHEFLLGKNGVYAALFEKQIVNSTEV